jgi:hypothetical protein
MGVVVETWKYVDNGIEEFTGKRLKFGMKFKLS